MMRIAVLGLASTVLLGTGVLAQDTRSAANQQAEARPGTWSAERAAMLKQVVERARKHVQSVRLMAQIGTQSPVAVKASETWLADLEKQVDADATRAAAQVDSVRPEHATLRIRFAQAMNAVDLAEVKFDNGMITTTAMNASLTAAAAVFLGPAVK